MEAKRTIGNGKQLSIPHIYFELFSQHISLPLFISKMSYMFPKLQRSLTNISQLRVDKNVFLWNFMLIVVLLRTKLWELFYFDQSLKIVSTCYMIHNQRSILNLNSSNLPNLLVNSSHVVSPTCCVKNNLTLACFSVLTSLNSNT